MCTFRGIALGVTLVLRTALVTADEPQKAEQPKRETAPKAPPSLEELGVQLYWGKALPQVFPLLTPEAVERLRFTAEQKEQIGKIEQEYQQKQVPIWKEEMAINVKLHQELETKVEAALGDDSRKLTREESDAILRKVQEEHDRRKMAALRPLEIKHDNLRREYLAKVEPLLTAEQRKTFLLVQKDKPEDRAPFLADPLAPRAPADEPKKEEPKDRRAQPEPKKEPLPDLGIIVIRSDSPPRPLLPPDAVEKLKLTPEQKATLGEIERDYLRSQQASRDEEDAAIDRVWKEHRTKLAALLGAGGRPKELTDAQVNAILRKLEPEYRALEEKERQKAEQQRERLRNDALAKVEALLTDEQKKTFARVKNVPELIGLPRVPPPRRMPPAAEDGPPRRLMPPAKDD